MSSNKIAEFDQSRPSVDGKLEHAWKKERLFCHLKGGFIFAVWAIGLVLLDLVIDWLFLIPWNARLCLLLASLTALGIVFYRHWWRPLRAFNPVRVALQVERKHPELQSLLVSYVQLNKPENVDQQPSSGLLAALKRQAVRLTAPVNFDEIVNFKALQSLGIFSSIVILIFTLLCINWTEFFRVLFIRMLNPQAAAAYPTQTLIDDISGNITVQEGAEIDIRVNVKGRMPRRGVLFVRPEEGGAWEKFALESGEEAEFGYHFDEAFRSFDYYVQLRDATSEKYRVEVIQPPQVVESKVTLKYPAYTGIEPVEVNSLNLNVVEGTGLLWQLRFDKPLTSGQMLRAGNVPLPLKMGDGGMTGRITFAPENSFDYQFRWTLKNYDFSYQEDINYFVQVSSDGIPRAEILFPIRDRQKATTQKILSVQFRADDDYGIARAWIVYSVNDGKEHSKPIGDYSSKSVEEDAEWELNRLLPEIKIGDTFTCAIEVSDNRTGKKGPNLARSRPRWLHIVSKAEFLRDVFEQKGKLTKEVDRLRIEENKSQTEVKTLKEEKPEERTPVKEVQP